MHKIRLALFDLPKWTHHIMLKGHVYLEFQLIHEMCLSHSH